MNKYPPLTGICKTAIEKEWCLGCSKLELESFTGVEKCSQVCNPREKIKEILGVQEELWKIK